ncbi:hypothetical protein CIT26_31430 [Mesorhizobium temperatum]|uniref:Uncharacterized protein n=1 Tax=Mesorhizobium temperatum TaxID=241416 RepID=A0A271LB31_9HYPH|nr:hypothetical protein CIT26_31430 [Mesorhizobium temperatum]
MVRQELRQRGQPVRRPQPDRAARSAALRHLGNQEHLGADSECGVRGGYVKNYGNEVNLFVDHSQIVQLEALRSGIWGTKSTWGRIQNVG